ncbi:MAG: DUF1801 domain-containing protein [bacterium]|nr:DUF1801 domain-containing protein [bacterium]
MQSKAKTVDEYLKNLPDDRREALETIRKMFKKNIDKRIVEHMNYGMAGYSVPHKIYPPGYHCDPKLPLPYAGFASQKNHMSLYLFGCYMDSEDMDQLQAEWKKTGKRMDIGKSCIRFKKIDDVPLDVIGRAVKRMTLERFLGIYEAARAGEAARKVAKKHVAKKKTAAKKAAKK